MTQQNPAPQTNRNAWIIVAILLGGAAFLCVLVVCAALYLVPARLGNFTLDLGPSQQVSETGEQSVAVETTPELIIDNEVGEVDVRTADVDEIQVEYTKKARAGDQQIADDIMKQIQVEILGTGNTVRVNTDVPTSLGANRGASVDLLITVPRDLARLEIETGVGDITVENVEAELALLTGVGEIQVDQATLTGASEIKTGVGDLSFDGALPPIGRVQIGVGVGDARLELPADSAFQLDATADIGTIYTDFNVSGGESGEAEFVGDKLTGSVGADPATLLVIGVDTGDIHLNQK